MADKPTGGAATTDNGEGAADESPLKAALDKHFPPAESDEGDEGAPGADDPQRQAHEDRSAGEPDGGGKEGDEGSEDDPVAKERKALQTEREQLAREREELRKSKESKVSDDPKKPKSIEQYSDAEVEEAIAFWSDPENGITNSEALIQKARNELAKRAGRKEVDIRLNAERTHEQRAQWVEKAKGDFPEAFSEDGKVKECELTKLAAQAYDNLGLERRADGTYRALEWAYGVLARKAATDAKKAGGGNGNGNGSGRRETPPAIRGRSPASARPKSGGDDLKAEEGAALKRYDESRDPADLRLALKARLAPKQQ